MQSEANWNKLSQQQQVAVQQANQTLCNSMNTIFPTIPGWNASQNVAVLEISAFFLSVVPGGPMSLANRRRLEAPVLAALGLWGLVSAIQGAGLSMFVSGPHQYADANFIELVYFSVIAGVLVSLMSAWLASLLLGVSAIIATTMLYGTDWFRHDSTTTNSLLLAIALRPVFV